MGLDALSFRNLESFCKLAAEVSRMTELSTLQPSFLSQKKQLLKVRPTGHILSTWGGVFYAYT